MKINNQIDLVELIVKGDALAFKELYRLYYTSLCRFAYKYVEDIAESEDIVQETLLKVWEQHEKLEGIFNIKSYLFSAVKNTCINYLTHQKVINRYSENVTLEINLLSLQHENSAFAEEESELENKLMEAIEELPKQCGDIFKMKYLKGLKAKEIATQTNLSIRTVESHVFNALKALRYKFKDRLLLGLIIGSFYFL
jgi:RNA polymerase sigma-70 factor (ECF subfamily)